MTLLVCILVAVVTAYAPQPGNDWRIDCDGDCATTATGETPGPHIAACGPGWDLGDMLLVQGYGLVRCGDRFGRPPSRHAVEVWQPSVRDALMWGWRERQVVCRLVTAGRGVMTDDLRDGMWALEQAARKGDGGAAAVLAYIADVEAMTRWVIVDGGNCYPARGADAALDQQPVDIEWIEESRRGWARAAGKASLERDALSAEVLWLQGIIKRQQEALACVQNGVEVTAERTQGIAEDRRHDFRRARGVLKNLGDEKPEDAIRRLRDGYSFDVTTEIERLRDALTQIAVVSGDQHCLLTHTGSVRVVALVHRLAQAALSAQNGVAETAERTQEET